MANTFKPLPALVISQSPMVDSKGMATFAFLKLFQQMYTQISNAFNQLGQLIGQISAEAIITGRTEGIGTTVGHIDDTGVVQAPGLVSATDTAHGAVQLPSGATSNVLGSAAFSSDADFDPAGAANTAQSNAETFATAAANTAQSNAETFARDASNITTGMLSTDRLSGPSGSVTLAALTVGGTQGSLTFTNGLITASVDPT